MRDRWSRFPSEVLVVGASTLSSPHSASVNNAISSDLCSVSYMSIDDAVGSGPRKGCLLVKLDFMEAYRAVSVHPSDQRLLCVSWQSTIYIDKALPFGLQSAPKIFSALTDTMMWMLNDRGVKPAIDYWDDFLFVGPAHSPSCGEALSTTLALCSQVLHPRMDLLIKPIVLTPHNKDGFIVDVAFICGAINQ